MKSNIKAIGRYMARNSEHKIPPAAALHYNSAANEFECDCHYECRAIPKNAGFYWSHERRIWATDDKKKALKLLKYADALVREMLVDYLVPNKSL